MLTAIFTLLSPAAAYCNYTLFIVVRILEGVAEGVTFPAMHAMLARWIPPEERSKFAAIVYAGKDFYCFFFVLQKKLFNELLFLGSNFGSVVSFPLSGWLCTLEWGGGWPLCFYLFGGLGIVWFIAWIFLVYDTPQSHPRICQQELEYIKWTIGTHVKFKFYMNAWLILFCLHFILTRFKFLRLMLKLALYRGVTSYAAYRYGPYWSLSVVCHGNFILNLPNFQHI